MREQDPGPWLITVFFLCVPCHQPTLPPQTPPPESSALRARVSLPPEPGTGPAPRVCGPLWLLIHPSRTGFWSRGLPEKPVGLSFQLLGPFLHRPLQHPAPKFCEAHPPLGLELEASQPLPTTMWGINHRADILPTEHNSVSTFEAVKRAELCMIQGKMEFSGFTGENNETKEKYNPAKTLLAPWGFWQSCGPCSRLCAPSIDGVTPILQPHPQRYVEEVSSASFMLSDCSGQNPTAVDEKLLQSPRRRSCPGLAPSFLQPSPPKLVVPRSSQGL